jgi:putative transposase
LEWYKAKELRPDMNIDLDAFIVMPNHIHGIIAIGANEYNTDRDAIHRVSTEKQNNFGPQLKNLASILRGYKSAVTTFARKNNILFDWQPRFHDHIIQSQEEYEKIADYIYNNVANWHLDKFNNNP